MNYHRCIKAHVPDLLDFNGIMLVGEAPGANEEKWGKPFQGDAGVRLNMLLENAGIIRDECFITNVFHVRPQNNMVELFYATTKEAKVLPTCFPEHPYRGRLLLEDYKPELQRLHTEIEFLHPHLKVIVAMGAVALWALTGKNGITTHRGIHMPFTMGATSCSLIPTFHPAYLMRANDPATDLLVVKDLIMARDIVADLKGGKGWTANAEK